MAWNQRGWDIRAVDGSAWKGRWRGGERGGGIWLKSLEVCGMPTWCWRLIIFFFVARVHVMSCHVVCWFYAAASFEVLVHTCEHLSVRVLLVVVLSKQALAGFGVFMPPVFRRRGGWVGGWDLEGSSGGMGFRGVVGKWKRTMVRVGPFYQY